MIDKSEMSDKEKKSDKEGWRKNLLSGLSGGASKQDDEKVNKFSNIFEKNSFFSFLCVLKFESVSSINFV